MTLVDKLLHADKAILNQKATKTIKSKRLSDLLGEDTEITIRQISGRRMNDINSIIYDSEGNKDISKSYDLNILYCVEGIVEPSMKNQALMEYFGVHTPDELAEKLFDTEINRISSEIAIFSGVGNEEKMEEKVKNS